MKHCYVSDLDKPVLVKVGKTIEKKTTVLHIDMLFIVVGVHTSVKVCEEVFY